MENISALWNLFRKGESVANPAAWKAGQVSATALGAAIMAAIQVLAAFHVQIPVDSAVATAIAGGIIAIVNVLLTYATSDKIGILPAREPTVPANDFAPVQTISQADMQAGINFADKATRTRGQDIDG